MASAFQWTVDDEGIARLIFNLPNEKVNKLSVPILDELDSVLDELKKNPKIKVLEVCSGKSDTFVAGADLHSFKEIFKDPSKAQKVIERGHQVLNKLEALPFPSIAFINGACLGGGMELALACTYRVVSDHYKTVVGLPEVSLGIIPGWGGTQRMPRLVGLKDGLSLILSGKPIKAHKAWKIKLADAIIPAEFFESKSRAFTTHILTDEGKKQVEEKRQMDFWSRVLVDKNPIAQSIIYRMAEKDVLKKTKGHYPAPLVALKLIKETYDLPLKDGLKKEIQTFTDNITTAFVNAPNLIHLFFTQEALKKEKWVSEDVAPEKVSKAGVIGAGTMGSGITWLFSNQDIPVRFKDIDWQAVAKGFSVISALYAKSVKDKRMKASEATLKFHKVSGTTDYSGFKNCNLVIEAAVESLELKHQILKELEKVIQPEAIIGTNTSSLTISDMNKVMSHPERLVGMHFFNPPNKMPLVEVVASKQSSPKAIATAVDVCRKLGKSPVVVGDCPGFLVNRIFVPGANEIMLMYEEGADFGKLEKALLDFGMPMSPFVLADEVGNDVGYKVSKVFHQAYGERMVVPKLIELMNEHKLYGKKNGKGFYLYNKDKPEKPNPEAEKLRNTLVKEGKSVPDSDIQHRVLLMMVNEAARCLSEKVITNPAYLDMALIMGIGFPPFRGGLLRYADHLGINFVVERLKRFQELYGDRFTPAELLIDMQRNNKTFF